MPKVIILFSDYFLLVIGWALLLVMSLTVFINRKIYKAEERIYKLHNSLKKPQ